MKRLLIVCGLSAAAFLACLPPSASKAAGRAHGSADDNAAAPAGAAPLSDDQKASDATITLFKSDAQNKDIFAFDYGVPVSPALALIGTNETLSGSAALKPYTLQAPAADGGAKGAQSFAADIAPAWFLLGSDVNNYDNYIGTGNGGYDGAYGLRLANRTRFGTSLYLGDKGGGDPSKAKDSRLALGLSIAVLDQSDPLAAIYVPDKGPNKGRIEPVWAECADTVYATLYPDYDAKYLAAIKDETDEQHSLRTYRGSFDGLAAEAHIDPAGVTQANIDAAAPDVDGCLDDVCNKFPELAQRLHDALHADSRPADKAIAVHAVFEEINLAITDRAGDAAKKIANSLNVTKAFDVCIAKANAYARFGSKLDLGGGVVWDGEPGTANGFSKTSGAVWIAGRYPLNFPEDPTADIDLLSYWMIGGTVRAGLNETVATGNAGTPKFDANTVDAWVGLESYSADLKFAALAGYKDTMAVHAADAAFASSGFRWQISGAIRLSRVLSGLVGRFGPDGNAATTGAWLNVSYGSANGTVKTLDDKAILVTLSFSPGRDNLLGEGG
ncbi:MAG: hypothetical protein WDN01_19250 [Rhizomicrobium sp.]